MEPNVPIVIQLSSKTAYHKEELEIMLYIYHPYMYIDDRNTSIYMYIYIEVQKRNLKSHIDIYIYVICSGTVRQTPFGGKANNTKYL